MFVNHCLRTYAWGMILGAHDGLRPDAELLFVAALLHDLALTSLAHVRPARATLPVCRVDMS